MKDFCKKGRIEGLEIAVAFVDASSAVNEAVLLHDCDPVSAHLIGRAISSAALSASILSNDQRINLSWRYKGALKAIVVDAGQDGSLRATISPNHIAGISDNSEELYGDIGEIQAVVSANGKVINSGTTPVSLHDVVNDLAYHFCISDQIETSISSLIGFSNNEKAPVSLARGMIIQALPNCDIEVFDRIRLRLEKPETKELLRNESDKGIFDKIIKWLIKDEPSYLKHHVVDELPPFFSCTCSLEKMGAVMRSIPIPERMAIVKEGKEISINCHFCRKKYTLTIEDCILFWNQK